MFTKLTALTAALMLIPSALAGVIVPRRDTPNFYLIASSSNAAWHLKPLKNNNFFSSLTTGDNVKVFLEGGRLMVDQATPLITTINHLQDGVSTCAPGGEMMFIAGSSSNKCAKQVTFGLSSYNQNSQLGARLVYNSAASFYACPDGKVQFNPTAPSGCDAIDLWTVPATV